MKIFKFLKGAKSDYDQIKKKNVIRNLNFQFFVSDHLKEANYEQPNSLIYSAGFVIMVHCNFWKVENCKHMCRVFSFNFNSTQEGSPQ